MGWLLTMEYPFSFKAVISTVRATVAVAAGTLASKILVESGKNGSRPSLAEVGMVKTDMAGTGLVGRALTGSAASDMRAEINTARSGNWILKRVLTRIFRYWV